MLGGGTNWVILPDGTVHVIVANFSKSNCGGGSAFTRDCPPGSTGFSGIGCGGDVPTEIGPISGALRFKYGPITPADVGRALPRFTTPRGSIFTVQTGLPLAGQVWIGAIADARTTDCSDSSLHYQATAQGVVSVTVAEANLTISKKCVSNCPPLSSPGSIVLKGQVCNTGETGFTNINVSASVPGATITYSNATSLGIAFPTGGGGRLVVGDCVDYTCTFTPNDIQCGPFADIVVATGTDQTSYPKTVSVTNSSVAVFSPRLENSDFLLSFAAGTNRTYTVQFTDSLSPVSWQTATNFIGNCTVATFRDSITNARRFYRIFAQ